MRKDLGAIPAVFPMPVLMVASYDEDKKVCIMNAAWGQICDVDKIALFIHEDHKTTQGIKISKAFTVSLADVDHIAEADFVGIATGNKMPDKFERTKLHQVKSEHVNAPIITDFPLAMECELFDIIDIKNFYCVIGKIVNVSADEKVINEKGKVEPEKLNAFAFDQFQNGYYKMGEKIGQAWNAGSALMKN